MQNQLLIKTALLFLVTTCFAMTFQSAENPDKHHDKEHQYHQDIIRIKRAVKHPGFFRTLFSVIYEQWNDTKNTFGTVNKLLNDNFLPDNAPVTKAPEITTDANVSTTTEPYRISRAEFARILRRNVKGLQRLFKIELQDALQQSTRNKVEFKKNASVEVSKFL